MYDVGVPNTVEEVAPVKTDQPVGKLVPIPSNVSVYDVPDNVTWVWANNECAVKRKVTTKSKCLYILGIDKITSIEILINEHVFSL